MVGVGDDYSDERVNDNTIEAIIRLLTKLGPALDKKVIESKDEGKRLKQKEFYDSIYERLKELETLSAESPKNRASLRIKILIKNLFDNKDSGWSKTKEESKIQKKDEIAKQVIKKDQEQRNKTFGSNAPPQKE